MSFVEVSYDVPLWVVLCPLQHVSTLSRVRTSTRCSYRPPFPSSELPRLTLPAQRAFTKLTVTVVQTRSP